MTAISRQQPESKREVGTDGGTLSRDSQPTPLEGVEATTESPTDADASKAPQCTLDGADLSQSSPGRDTTTQSQKEPKSTESEKPLENVSTASNESPPEQVELGDSTTESRSGTSKAPDTPDRSDPPQSSTTTTSHNATEAERTQTNTTDVGTPDPFKNQCTNGIIDVPAQDSHLIRSSEDVKDGTVSDDLLSHAARSDHSNTEVMDRNEESSNPEGVSTPSIKLQEKTEVNQPTQKEELCSTEDANKQKASDPAQVENGQPTTPSMEEDVNQQMAKYEEAIRGLKAKLLSMETFASQEARDHGEDIKRLEAKISTMEEIVDQQKQEYKEEIEFFRAIVADMDQETPKEIGRLGGKHEKEVQRLEAVVVDTDKRTSKEIERLEGKHKKEIQRLEAIVVDMDKQAPKEIERLERKHEKDIQRLEAIVVDMDKQTSKEIERLERKHEKDIQRLEAIVVDMDKQTSKEIERLERKHEKDIQRLEAIVVDMGKQGLKEIERLQPKVFSEEDAKQPKTKEPPQAQATKLSTTAANQKIDGLDQGSGIKKEKNKSLPSTSASGKQANIPLPQTVVPKADSLSVTDVANLVKPLNAEIEQIVQLLTESLSGLEPPASDNESEIDELRNYLGPWLCDKLREISEPDPLITQLTLQTGLANACSSVVNDSPLWCDGSIFHGLYRGMAEKEGQAAADEWRAKAASYLNLPQCEDANKKYLTEVVRKLATAAVGGTLKAESLLSQHNQQIEVIARLAAKLHKTITEDVTSSELITYTVSCDTKFDASQMEDTETKRGSHGKVICTQEMGLLCRKRVEPKKPRGPLKDWGVTMKAKVVLAATLEAYGL
ncbi:hypothetical protein JOM56_002857 [Amanita muscaria]